MAPSGPPRPRPFLRVAESWQWQLYLLWPAMGILACAAPETEAAWLRIGTDATTGSALVAVAWLVALVRWGGEKRPWFLVFLGLVTVVLAASLLPPAAAWSAHAALFAVALWGTAWWRYLARDLRGSGTAPCLAFVLATHLLAQTLAGAPTHSVRAALAQLCGNLACLSVLLLAMRPLPGSLPGDRDNPGEGTPDPESPRLLGHGG